MDAPAYQVVGGRLDVAGGPLLAGVQRGAAAIAAGDAGGRLLGQGDQIEAGLHKSKESDQIRCGEEGKQREEEEQRKGRGGEGG